MRAIRISSRVLLVCVVGVVTLAQIRAQSATNGVIRGSVVDRGTKKTYPGIAVTLEWQANGKPSQKKATTDANGAYVFSGLPVDDTTTMSLFANVDGKSLRKEGVALSTWTPEVLADLEIVQAGGDASKVHVGRLTTILTPSDAPEVVPVIEFWEIHNDSETPFAQVDASGQAVGFVINLPENATEARIEGDQTPAEIRGVTVVLTQPLQPQSTFVSISYAVPKADKFSLKRNLTALVEEALVMIGGGAWVVTAKEFARGEPADIHGAKYETFSRHQIANGSALEIAFKKGKAKPTPSGGDANSSSTILIVLIAVVSVAVGGLVGSWIAQSRKPQVRETPAATLNRRETTNRKAAPVDATSVAADAVAALTGDELESAKQVYLTLIARLDEFHNDGEIPDAMYRQLRDGHKSALARVIARMNA